MRWQTALNKRRTEVRRLLLHGYCRENESERLVSAIAQCAVAALLAAAEIDRGAFGSGIFLWYKFGPLVAAVAEWLRLALATAAPVVILAILDFDREWRFACDLCSTHTVSLFLLVVIRQ
jgi:hypothetical protein